MQFVNEFCFVLQKEPGYRFKMRATATDQGTVPRQAHIEPDIIVVESHKKPPTFTSITPAEPVVLKENFMDYNANITTLTAQYVTRTDDINSCRILVTFIFTNFVLAILIILDTKDFALGRLFQWNCVKFRNGDSVTYV